MARYVLECRALKSRLTGPFEEMKQMLSEATEKDLEITNKEWEKIQLLEPEHLPFEVGLFSMFEAES